MLYVPDALRNTLSIKHWVELGVRIVMVGEMLEIWRGQKMLVRYARVDRDWMIKATTEGMQSVGLRGRMTFSPGYRQFFVKLFLRY